MAFGCLQFEYAPPAQPSGTSESSELYLWKIRDELRKHFLAASMNPVRQTWIDLFDVPSVGSNMPAYILTKLTTAGIDPALTTVQPKNSGSLDSYCVTSNGEVCYHYFSLGWAGTGNGPFKVTVPLSNGQQVQIILDMLLTWDKEFPGPTPT